MHVRNKHQWSHWSCDHDPLDEGSRDKPWMVQGKMTGYMLSLGVGSLC